ncbi:RNA polymerase sigma factor [Niabella soli]|uniref:RNA polymerase subunit sigma-70 n=1 Tax=Niabella soli DSM 19437 TaxID=929713 RepID=W0F0B8_9BACT|nr:sigma-70 family RNA polymerase sigma factor [Niabella soli]AHF14894.1 RNA polymerase subunit sigma-70 [Niabella soli DSM 19437]
MDSEELIRQCKKHNRRAQEHIFKQYAPLMMATCMRYLNHRENSEECMLAGFQKFFEKIDQFQFMGAASVTGYLKRIMINECLMELRKNKPVFLTADTVLEPVLNEHSDGLARLSAKEILLLLEKLPEGYRTIFNLYVIENLSHREIAALLKISEGTSKSQLSKARFLLQQLIVAHER